MWEPRATSRREPHVWTVSASCALLLLWARGSFTDGPNAPQQGAGPTRGAARTEQEPAPLQATRIS